MRDLTPETCPERGRHGQPFRYCPIKGCGWIEQPEPCRAVLAIKGEVFLCTTAGHHTTHASAMAGALWSSKP